MGSPASATPASSTPGYRTNTVIGATLTLLVPNTQTFGATSSGLVDESTGQADISSETAQTTPGTPTLYVFDGALRAVHELRTVASQNPIQTGATITDHAYDEPVRLSTELVMSDAMQSYTVGQFSGNPSRSVAAFQALAAIKASHALCEVDTRLAQYSNMLIVELSPEESVETRFGLKCRVVFQEILLADNQQTTGNPATNSQRPQTTSAQPSGQAQVQPVPTSVTNNNNIANAPDDIDLENNVEGAGSWSSDNTNTLDQVFN